MHGRFLIIVTIATVLFTVGVVTFAFKDAQSGGQASSELQATVSRYWRKAKAFVSPKDSEVSKYLEEASQAVDSAMKSITR